MDGDSTAKTMDQGANSVIRNVDGSDSIHEASHQAVRSTVSVLPHWSVISDAYTKQNAVGEKTQGTGTSAFHKDGPIGKQFKADGAIGSIGEKVGGPFASNGAIGKNFNPDGAIGGTVQENLGKKE